MSDKPLMPKATAVWLVDNTSLTFEQIADFCGMHHLEVKGIADEDVAKGIKGIDPIATGQLTREQIEEAEKDEDARLKLAPVKYRLPHGKSKKTPRYTPVSKRQDKPDAIYWLLRNHAELTDPDIIKLIGTTKATINKIRDRGHWNSQNIKAVDPVTLGLCTQIELDFVVARAAARKPRQPRKTPAGLKSADETIAAESMEADAAKGTATETASAPALDKAAPDETAEAQAPEAAAAAAPAPESGEETKEDAAPPGESAFAAALRAARAAIGVGAKPDAQAQEEEKSADEAGESDPQNT